MPKLTKRFVETLTIKKVDYIVFDSDVNGFGVRVLPSGKKSYMIQYRAGGRTRRLAIGKHGTITTDEARKETLRRLGEVAKGEKTPPRSETNAYALPQLSRYANGL